jgi:hypothetical protein
MLSPLRGGTWRLTLRPRCKVKLSFYRRAGDKGERMYSTYSFLTSALDVGELSASCPGLALPPGKGPPIPIGCEAGWALARLDTEARGEILCSYRVSNSGRMVVQSAVRPYTDWATPVPRLVVLKLVVITPEGQFSLFLWVMNWRHCYPKATKLAECIWIIQLRSKRMLYFY